MASTISVRQYILGCDQDVLLSPSWFTVIRRLDVAVSPVISPGPAMLYASRSLICLLRNRAEQYEEIIGRVRAIFFVRGSQCPTGT